MPPNTSTELHPSTELRTGRAFLSACRLAFRVSPLTFFAIVLLGVVGGSVLAPATIAAKSLINELTSPQRGQHITVIVLLAITASGLTALGSAAIYLAGIPAYRLAAQVQLETETQLATACGRFPGVEPLEDATVQDRMSLAQRGAHEAPELVTSTITQFLTTSSRIVTFVGAVWSAFPPMVIALLLSAVPLALLQRRIQQRSIYYNEQANVAYRWRDYFSQLFLTPATAREMRLYGAQEVFAGRLRARLAEALTI